MHVEHFMTNEPIACDTTFTIDEVANLMNSNQVGCVVVLEDGKVVGLVTDRDLAIQGLADGRDVTGTKVTEVMTGPDDLVTITLEDNIFTALEVMRGAKMARRLPVVNEHDQLVGLVSLTDIAVVASHLTYEVLHNLTHNALEETHVPTGAKRMVKKMREPKKSREYDPDDLRAPITSPHNER